MQQMTRTRIAPSPTGEDIHIGNLYTALINYVFSRKHDGSFILRIEDTDRTRFVPGAIEKIIQTIGEYGLSFDEGPGVGGEFGPYMQSERLDLYHKYADELVEKGKAYYCFCSKEQLEVLKVDPQTKNVRHWDVCSDKNNSEKKEAGVPFVVRLRVLPDKKLWFHDLIRGEIAVSSNEIDDQVLLKSDGYPTYHLGVVVDDHLMKISHIIRAEEWISSTPKHVLLYEAFGWEQPIFAHVPILRNPDKSKLSKRKNPVWASWYLQEGYLPEAVLNYLALMGWSHPEQKEIFTLEEFIRVFDLKDVKPVGPAFDLQKLRWMNQQYIQNMRDIELVQHILSFYKDQGLDEALVTALIPLLKTRMITLKDFAILTGYFFAAPAVAPRNENEKEIVIDLRSVLSDVADWSEQGIFPALKTILDKHSVRMPVLYYLLTGDEKGLPLPQALAILGKEKTLRRLESM
jgi:glutamyl-tRNA synthetase